MFIWNVERSIAGRGYLPVLRRHLPPALISGGILLAAELLPLNLHPQIICPFFLLTGYSCLSCGLTRGLIAMAHGHWAAVLGTYPLAVLLYPATALFFAVNAAAVICRVRLTPGPWLKWHRRGWLIFLGIFGLLVLLNWLYRLALGLK